MTSPNELADRTGGQDRARWTALVVLCVGMLMIALDATAVNVALPVIQADLGLSQSSLAWVVNAYLVAFGGLLLLAGRLGDLVSRRRDVRHVRLGVLYLQTVLGYDAMRTGMAFLPNSLVMGLLSVRYAEPLVTRFGARTTLVSGLVLIGAGLALFSRVPVGGAYLIDVLPATLLLGTGVGVSFPALMMLSMSGATPSDAGLASGLVNTTMQVGAALGLAVLATLSAARTETLLARGVPVPVAATEGFHRGFVAAAGLVAVAVVVALVVIRDPHAAPVSSPAPMRRSALTRPCEA